MDSESNYRKLFVGNLSAEVTEQDVRSAFEIFGDIDGIEFDKAATSGYCLILFATRKAARKAFKKMDNKRLWNKKIHCNIKLKHKEAKEVKSHTFLKDVIVNDINDTSEVIGKLQDEYKKYGKVKEVFIPTHLVESTKGVAFITFKREKALVKALASEGEAIREPVYTHRSSVTINGGGYGGRYGYEDEYGRYQIAPNRFTPY